MSIPGAGGFQDYLSTFRSAWGALTLVVTAGPLALWTADLTPPWPSENGSAAAVLATVAAMAGVIAGYFQGAAAHKLRRRGLLALGAALVVLLAYMACWSLVYFETPQPVGDGVRLRRYVLGLGPPMAEGLSRREAFFNEGGTEAWSETSLLAGRTLLLGTLLSFFSLLTFGFGSLQKVDRSSRP